MTKKITFFLIFDFTSWFVTQGQKEGGIYFGPWNHERWLSQQRTHKFEYVSFVGEQIRSLSRKQSKLNFWNQLHPKIAFLCRFWTQKATWRPNHTILTSSVKAILKAMIDTFFWGPSLGGGSELCIKGGRFFQRERVLCGWLAGPSHISRNIHLSVRLSVCLSLCLSSEFIPAFFQWKEVVSDLNIFVLKWSKIAEQKKLLFFGWFCFTKPDGNHASQWIRDLWLKGVSLILAYF